MIKKYPTILRRYMSSFIDAILLMIIFSFSVSFFEGKNNTVAFMKFAVPVFIFIFYEPVLTSTGCTIGQLITGIRVRKIKDLKKISFFSAFVRYMLKSLLGFISFFSIIFSEKNRAIHDYGAGTIVINKTDMISQSESDQL